MSVADQSSPLAGTQVVVPAGALSTPTLITIGYASSPTGFPADVLVAEVGPQGTGFSLPVTITMPYTAQYLATNGITDPATLKLVAIKSTAANETLRTIAQDTTRNTVTAQAMHSSNFGVVGYTLASLSGDYAMNFTMIDASSGNPMPVQIAVNVPDTPYSGVLSVPFPGYGFRDEQGSVTFDGAGNYSWSANRNIGGNPVPAGGNGTYTVDADGNMRLDFGIEGTVLAGGSTFVLAATHGVPVIEMGMGLKKGGTFDDASLNGTYAVALYYSDAPVAPGTINLIVPTVPYSASLPVPFPVNGLSSELRTMIFDGAGNYSWSGTRNTNGTSTSIPPGSGTYTVASDGALTLDTGLTGQLLAGASTLLLTSPSGKVQIGAGVKKGGTFSSATLTGRYTVAYHYSDAAGGSPTMINISIPSTPYVSNIAVPFPLYAFNSEVRTMTFDGMGGYIWTGKADRGGVSNPNLQGSGTYVIDADGTLTIDNQVAGNVLEGGSTFVLAPTGGPGVKIGVGVLK